jgi:uncharacterized flavoprotein (TIGR03862 family)
MIAIVGAGPAGLMAAEYLAWTGHSVTIYDQMPTPGRKFLLAGRGGLNLTHSEPIEMFLQRYGATAPCMAPAVQGFPPSAVRAWCEGLGEEVFVGSSGRVFPRAFKAAPLLRAWLRRLEALGVVFRPRHRWLGWGKQGGALRLVSPAGEVVCRPDATLLALGGASWPRMGSDGHWVGILQAQGVEVRALRASNVGVCIDWSPVFRARFEGAPLKRIAVTAGGRSVRGEAVVTAGGLEGGAIYAVGAALRDALDRAGIARLTVDLRPDIDAAALSARVDGPRQGVSLANVLRQGAGLAPVASGLVQEALRAGHAAAPLSHLIKALPLTVTGMEPIGRAISSAGGLALGEVDENFMVRRLPGVFVAGEMLDWDAPTGGYLLQGCFSTAIAAARGLVAFMNRNAS